MFVNNFILTFFCLFCFLSDRVAFFVRFHLNCVAYVKLKANCQFYAFKWSLMYFACLKYHESWSDWKSFGLSWALRLTFSKSWKSGTVYRAPVSVWASSIWSEEHLTGSVHNESLFCLGCISCFLKVHADCSAVLLVLKSTQKYFTMAVSKTWSKLAVTDDIQANEQCLPLRQYAVPGGLCFLVDWKVFQKCIKLKLTWLQVQFHWLKWLWNSSLPGFANKACGQRYQQIASSIFVSQLREALLP